MAKARKNPSRGKKSNADPEILLLGNGPSLPWWHERLEEARATFAHLESHSEGGLPWPNPDIIIETEDLRFGDSGAHAHKDMDHLDEAHDHDGEGESWDEEDDLLPTVGGANGHRHRHGPDDMEILIPESGVILVPCYSSSPTMLASIYGDHAAQVVGYALFPRPDAVNGLGIIEVARSLRTSDESWEAALQQLTTLGFTPEAVGDAPAGVFGRTVAMLINEAALAFSDGIASVEDIDNAMQLGVNYPKGLFEWADELGPELILDMLEGLYDHYLDDRYRPAPLVKHVVAAGLNFTEL